MWESVALHLHRREEHMDGHHREAAGDGAEDVAVQADGHTHVLLSVPTTGMSKN